MQMRAALCIGGTNVQRQKDNIRREHNFIIGTPGRIKDFTRGKVVNLSLFHTVVLDEADRMVDIGFINDIKLFISMLPQDRQSLFFSATIGRKEQELIQAFVKNPVTVSVKTQDTAVNVEQNIIKVSNPADKVNVLHDLLIKKEFEKVVIFGSTKWGIQKLTDELVNRGFKAGAIHGNKNQSQRQRVLDLFKKDQINILLATDVASRGLDINNVSHVINYDLPGTYEDYIHRIGRTGRANKQGAALTFVS
jgi:superfamily II DNA/RNA helicase